MVFSIRFQFIIILFFLATTSHAQQFYRIKADYSIKQKQHDGTQSLTMGTVYYDKNFKKIVYKNKFPNTETWITIDTTLYKIIDDKIISKSKVPAIAELTIFHIALSGQLSNYGFDKSSYKISNVEKQNDLVITTWLPPQKFSKLLGKILISTKDKRLFGIIFYNPQNEISSKQFFEDFQNFNGFDFPSKIVQINYVNNKEDYQVITYKNILTNQTNESNMYNFVLPVK